MAFTIPAFPITCDIYTGPFVGRVFRLNSPCNLALGRRVLPAPGGYFVVIGEVAISAQLLLPPLTDIRDDSQGISPKPDIVEVPSGSGRWYGVLGWDDFGKGFPNEHRIATLSKIGEFLGADYVGSNWPIPGP